jgi:heterodisulfide reductase subunit C
MKKAVFWDVMTCASCKKRCFGGTLLRNVLQLLFHSKIFPSSLFYATLKMEAIISSETSVLKQPHGVSSQKSLFFIVIALKTLNLT